MKHFTFIILSILFIGSSFFSNATPLVYKWKAGTIYRFQATVLDDISTTMNMMGMNGTQKDTYKTETTFALKVSTVQANGTADGILYVEQFKVTDKAGKILASMAGLPKEALKSPVSVDKKGNFTFKKIVYMIVQEKGSNLVVSGKAENNKVSATTTGPDGTQLSVHAEFDPKTGTLKTGYTVATVGTPKEKKVAVKEDAPKVDIIPYQFLELLLLPEGDVTPGQAIAVKSSGMDMTVKMESITAGISTLVCDFKTDMKEATKGETQPAMKATDDNNPNMGMDMNMGNMGDMGNMQGMDGMGGMTEEEKAMTPDSKTDGKITSTFDVNKGVFKSCKGTVNTSTKTAGIDMTVKSTLVLTGLN